MKNRKLKILLLLSTVLLLMLGNTVLGATSGCSKNNGGIHILAGAITKTEHEAGKKIFYQTCKLCGEYGVAKSEDGHEFNTAGTCTDCGYKCSHNFSGGNVCATCGYMQVATTTPTTSTETTTTTSEGDPLCSHMYETGEPVYKSISEKKHIKEIIKTCMRCGRTIIAQERQEHSKYDTYESEGAKGHRKISKCSICNWKKTSGILEHTFENGMCTVEGCEYKKATSTTTKSLFSVSYASMCVGQTASCYTLTGCTDKSGVTWEITGDAVTRTDSTLLGKKAR